MSTRGRQIEGAFEVRTSTSTSALALWSTDIDARRAWIAADKRYRSALRLEKRAFAHIGKLQDLYFVVKNEIEVARGVYREASVVCDLADAAACAAEEAVTAAGAFLPLVAPEAVTAVPSLIAAE
jgi:hypothetical protein